MSQHIEELESELRELRDFKKSIFEKTKAWYNSCGDKIDIDEFGDTIDVIKDLAETEEKCAKARYYLSIVKAMEDAEKEEEEFESRFGYNHNRYPSSGRFASAGHGVRMGYPHLPAEMWDRRMMERYGYPVYYDGEEHSGLGNVRTGYGENGMPMRSEHHETMDPETEEYGRHYSRYRQARRHYTETKDAHDKTEMDKHAMEHFGKALRTFREIWGDVQPDMRKKMKMDLEKLVGEMNV